MWCAGLKASTAGLVVVLVILACFSCYAQLKLSDLRVKYESLSRTHAQLMSKYESLQANHSNLLDRYAELKGNYSKLIEEHKALLSKYQSLSSNYESLRTKYGKLSSNYTALKNTFNELQSKLRELSETASKLRAWLAGNVSELTALVNHYKEEVSNLSSKNLELMNELSRYRSWLESNITYYEGVVANLSRELSNYEEYVSEVNTYVSLTTVNQSVRDAFLREALVAASNISASFGNVNLIPNVFKWVLTNTYYQRDPYIPTYYWGLSDNIWKLPNQTVKEEGGDCEDLALLTYAILKNKGVKAWLILWYSETSGHAAVLAKYGGNWYVIDPAGEWLNGNTLYLRMYVEDSSGRSWIIWINMLVLEPEQKQWLIHNKFAKIVWYDLVNDKEESNPNLPRYGNLQETLTAWLNYWGRTYKGFKLMDIGLLKDFNTINDLINYLQTHT